MWCNFTQEQKRSIQIYFRMPSEFSIETSHSWWKPASPKVQQADSLGNMGVLRLMRELYIRIRIRKQKITRLAACVMRIPVRRKSSKHNNRIKASAAVERNMKSFSCKRLHGIAFVWTGGEVLIIVDGACNAD